MSFPRLLLFATILLFGGIAVMGWMNKDKETAVEGETELTSDVVSWEVDLDAPEPAPLVVVAPAAVEKSTTKKEMVATAAYASVPATLPTRASEALPVPDSKLVEELFRVSNTRLPIVETITYSRKVPWLHGNLAWVSDYASHYKTSRHFIARSLNGKRDYFNQTISEGDRFNVFKPGIDLQFFLVVDCSRNKLLFYYYDAGKDERALLKTYDVGLGRPEANSPSGILTPLGRYSLGERVAIYKPGKMGIFRNQRIEMITEFGTRWIPFDKEIADCTAPAKGLGIHGVPYTRDASSTLIERKDSIGKYASNGCIRMRNEDIEEVFSIIITKPAFIEIVKDFQQASLPGKEANKG